MSLPYYKRFPRDFFEGTIGMGFETKCAYGLVLDMIYMRDGRLPDDPRYISGMLGCSVRKWNSIRSELVELGKLICENGIISNFRADYLCEERRTYQDKQAENRSRPNKNNEIKSPPSPPKHHHTEPEEEVGDKSPTDTRREDVAFQMFVGSAKRQPAWSVPAKLNKQRRSALKARLTENDGLDGWGRLLARAEASPFLTGQTSAGFSLSFDWFVKPANLLKVMEGNYDDRTAKIHSINGGRSEGRSGISGRGPDSFDRLAERLAGNTTGANAGADAERGGADEGVIDAEFTWAAG